MRWLFCQARTAARLSGVFVSLMSSSWFLRPERIAGSRHGDRCYKNQTQTGLVCIGSFLPKEAQGYQILTGGPYLSDS